MRKKQKQKKTIKIYEEPEWGYCPGEFNGANEDGVATTWLCTRRRHDDKTPHQWVGAQREQNEGKQRPNGIYTEARYND